MMPRTKHLVITLAFGLFLLVGVAVAYTRSYHEDVFAFIPPQAALVTESQEPTRKGVVQTDTTRETMRTSLKEQLTQLVSDGAIPETERAPSPRVASLDTPPEGDSTPVSDAVPRCDVLTIAPAPLPSWGEVTVAVQSGVRSITSLAEDGAGVPVHTLTLPLLPQVTGEDACLPPRMIGILLDGSVITPNTPVNTNSEGLAGYAIDGFPIFGPYEEGKELVSADLDACHGHVHAIIDQGVPTSMYHYHITEDAPYTLGCFRGTPVY
jgi:YHYH protein